MTPEAATALLMVDVIGTMRMSHAVIPLITYGNGVSPDNPINCVPVTYCAAKGAIRRFTAALARDVAPEIRVKRARARPHLGQLGTEERFGGPREVAETVLFLASDGAGYINGQVLHVEGGWIPAG